MSKSAAEVLHECYVADAEAAWQRMRNCTDPELRVYYEDQFKAYCKSAGFWLEIVGTERKARHVETVIVS
jgi:hypothetical protein